MGKFKFIEPVFIEAGSDRLGLGIMMTPPQVDCRVLDEETYQQLKRAYDTMFEGQDIETGTDNAVLPDVVFSEERADLSCTTCKYYKYDNLVVCCTCFARDKHELAT